MRWNGLAVSKEGVGGAPSAPYGRKRKKPSQEVMKEVAFQRSVGRAFTTALMRQCDEMPESQLMAAVIWQAFIDALEAARLRSATSTFIPTSDGELFFEDGRMEFFADAAGIPRDHVRHLYTSGINYSPEIQ